MGYPPKKTSVIKLLFLVGIWWWNFSFDTVKNSKTIYTIDRTKKMLYWDWCYINFSEFSNWFKNQRKAKMVDGKTKPNKNMGLREFT